MSDRKPRFEIVRTDADQPWHARLIAGNGEELWRTSESYVQRASVVAAVGLLVEAIAGTVTGRTSASPGSLAIEQGPDEDHLFFTFDGEPASPAMYDVDEREEATS